MQRALGAAFAERSMEGTFVAREAGVDWPASSTDLTAWPVEYRLGLAEGFTLSSEGFLALQREWLPTALAVLAPVPLERTAAFFKELAEKINDAGRLNRTTQELSALGDAISDLRSVLPAALRSSWDKIHEAVVPPPF